MPNKYFIAGCCVSVNRTAPGMPSAGCSTTSLSIDFVPQSMIDTHIKEREGELDSDLMCLQLPEMHMGRAYLSHDGKRAYVEAGNRDTDVALQIRRVVPFASAIQGRVVLHASAVRENNSVYGFIGESGAGKSTVVKALARNNLSVVSDDLLSCAMDNNKIVIPCSQDSEQFDTKPELRKLYFLSRAPGIESPIFESVSKRDGLSMLIKNGFGELRHPAMWETQFNAYSQIVDSVPVCRLTLPDNLMLLGSVANKLQHDMLVGDQEKK